MCKPYRVLRLACALVVAGGMAQAFSCSLKNDVGFLRDFNPCGSVLDCTAIGGAAGYRFLTSGYQGPGVDVNIDPSCTYPPYCNVATTNTVAGPQDPFSP